MILSNTLPIIIQNKQNKILQMQYLKSQKKRLNQLKENNMVNNFYNKEYKRQCNLIIIFLIIFQCIII